MLPNIILLVLKQQLELLLVFILLITGKNNSLICMIIFDHTDKSNTSLETVKGLLSFVYTHNVNKTLCFCKIKKTNSVLSPWTSFWNVSQKLTKTQPILDTQTCEIYLKKAWSVCVFKWINIEYISNIKNKCSLIK